MQKTSIAGRYKSMRFFSLGFAYASYYYFTKFGKK